MIRMLVNIKMRFKILVGFLKYWYLLWNMVRIIWYIMKMRIIVVIVLFIILVVGCFFKELYMFMVKVLKFLKMLFNGGSLNVIVIVVIILMVGL